MDSQVFPELIFKNLNLQIVLYRNKTQFNTFRNRRLFITKDKSIRYLCVAKSKSQLLLVLPDLSCSMLECSRAQSLDFLPIDIPLRTHPIFLRLVFSQFPNLYVYPEPFS